MNLVKEVYPNVPIYGVGLSLGGATAYHLHLRNPEIFDGTILVAPALSPSADSVSNFSTISFLGGLFGTFLPKSLRIFNIKA